MTEGALPPVAPAFAAPAPAAPASAAAASADRLVVGYLVDATYRRAGSEVGITAVERFAASYAARPAGLPHSLVVLRRGFAGERDWQPYRASFAANGIEPAVVDVEPAGLDLGAYRQLATGIGAGAACVFLNTASEILVADWLARLAAALVDPAIGVVGASGSWESPRSYAAAELRDHLRSLRVGRAGRAVIGLWRRREFPPFPNPHLRTNAFLVRPELVARLAWPPTPSRAATHRLESGRASLTRQVLALGYDACVVGADGRAVHSDAWPNSRTFRSGDQENLLVADNRTRQYAEADEAERGRLRELAWGPTRATDNWVEPVTPSGQPKGPLVAGARAPAGAPLVSVLTTSFNHERWLGDTLRSVEAQAYPNLEHIVVDDGSSDGSVGILAGWSGSRLRWEAIPNGGQAVALNRAFRASRGEIIGWLSSDDAYYGTDVVGSVVELFERRPDVALVYGHAVLVDADGFQLVMEWVPPSGLLRRLPLRVIQPAAFVRRSALGDSLVDESFDIAMDTELWLRLRSRHAIARLGRVLAVERHQPERKSYTRPVVLAAEAERLDRLYGGGGRVSDWRHARWSAVYRLVGLSLVPSAVAHPAAFRGSLDSRARLLLRQALRPRARLGPPASGSRP